MTTGNTHSTPNETCVLCAHTTGRNLGDTIDQSFHYVDGCGQLCARCHQALFAEGFKVSGDGPDPGIYSRHSRHEASVQKFPSWQKHD